MAAIALRRGSFSSDDESSNNGSGDGGMPNHASLYGYHTGPTLTSLEYNPNSAPFRRHSLMENQRLSQSSCMGDDLSLVGEYDNNSVRSDKQRPGRRASLSVAIELTRSPPKAANSGRAGRRSSFFGNKDGKDKEQKNAEAMEKLASKTKSSRRASMAGYPAASEVVPLEPATTPAFFHSRKKDKTRPTPPDRRKTRSFDKTDPRVEKVSSQVRPGQKIKRPGKGGSRRASMGAIPRRFSLSKSSNKGSNKGSNRSILSSSNSFSSSGGSDSYEDVSEDDDEHYSHSSGDGGGPVLLRRTKNETPISAYANNRSSKIDKDKIEDDLGYSDHNAYDPQLPPPPAPPIKASSSVKRAFQNRRGSTGMAAGFTSTSAAQRSLKESLNWKASQQDVGISSTHTLRRSSAASSIANSVATDVASNVRKGPADIPPGRRLPADVPPGRRMPADVPPGGRRGPSDVPPGKKGPSDVPPSPSKIDRALGDMDSSTSSFSMDSDFNPTPTPVSRKLRSDLQSSQHSGAGMSTYGNASSRTGNMSNVSALGSNLMDDVSDGSHGDGVGTSAMSGSTQAMGGSVAGQHERRRTGQRLPALQAGPVAAPAARRSSSLLVAVGGAAGVLNPYGAGRRANGDYDDDEADDDEEELLEKEEKVGKEVKESTVAAKTLSDGGGSAITNRSTAVTAPTLTTATYSDFSAADFSRPKESKSKDDGSDGSMTSEVPNEKDNMKDVEATGDWSRAVKDARDIGDWSQGVNDEMLRPNKYGTSDHNSLLDRYPGSEIDYGGVGYGYSHLQNKEGILDGYDYEGERKNGDADVELPDLYDEDYSSLGWREHRPRAAESIEFINMEQLMSKAKNTKGLHLPTFTPAHGCTNASDFIVRCFVARLRAGMTVTKHSRSRFVKSHDRILHILPTGYHVTWIPETEEEATAKSAKKIPTKLDLTKCVEVRHAWSRDPKSSRYTGTATLRSKCKDGAANRSFALIYPQRTVDFTAMSVDQCKILMEGFSALCFRLQMARLEQQAADESTQHTGMSGVEHDNDSTTASLTATNLSAPWGL